MTDFNLESYLAGIYRAQAQGLITYATSCAPEPGVMRFSNHIPWEIGGVTFKGELSFTNTRPLYEIIHYILNFFDKQTLEFLELGPGAGNACFELYCLAEKLGIRIRITTVSYTPINPYMPILLSGYDLMNVLAAAPDFNIIEEGPQGTSWYISIEKVFQLQTKEGCRIFGTLPEPYIDHQFIGKYPDDINLEFSEFDIIYDMFGPIHRKELEALTEAYAHLSDQGVLFFVFNPKYPPGQIMLEGARGRYTPIFKETDSVIVDISNSSALVAKSDSKLAICFRRKFNEKSQTVWTRSMIDFIRWL